MGAKQSTPPPLSDEQKIIACYFENVLELDKKYPREVFNEKMYDYMSRRREVFEQIRNAARLLKKPIKFSSGANELHPYYESDRYTSETENAKKTLSSIEYLKKCIIENTTLKDCEDYLEELKKEVEIMRNATMHPIPPAYKEDAPPAFDPFDATKMPSAPAQ
jgi:hypothetical protein